jgi:hypothetical protein
MYFNFNYVHNEEDLVGFNPLRSLIFHGRSCLGLLDQLAQYKGESRHVEDYFDNFLWRFLDQSLESALLLLKFSFVKKTQCMLSKRDWEVA